MLERDGLTNVVAIHAARWVCDDVTPEVRRASYAALITRKVIRDFETWAGKESCASMCEFARTNASNGVFAA